MKIRRIDNRRPSRQASFGARLGATAVEFAIVCPVVLGMVFGMMELSRYSVVTDSVKTSVLAGSREAVVAQTTAANVQAEMEDILLLYGINNSTISVTPAVINGPVTEVSIEIDVPFSASNGFYLIGTRDIEIDVNVPR